MNEPKEILKDIQNSIDECNRIHKAMIGCDESMKKKHLLELISEWASFIHDLGVYRWSTLQDLMDVDAECREAISDLEREVRALEDKVVDLENDVTDLEDEIETLKNRE